MILGIDGSNLRAGGGVTHLVELLHQVNPREFGFEKVIVWTNTQTAALLSSLSADFEIRPVQLLDGNVAARLFWQQFCLPRYCSRECNLLFNPGCGYIGTFRPYVTMSRNMLPFDQREIDRYGTSITGLRFKVLRKSHTICLRRADGVIFLTDHAQRTVGKRIGNFQGQITKIPHGVKKTYFRCPRKQLQLKEYSSAHPMKLLYVSTIDCYKHQWKVAEGVAILRQKGLPIAIDFVGRHFDPALKRLVRTVDQYDPNRQFLNICGARYGTELVKAYHDADVFVFASSCENLPNILLEAMAAGLPIACSECLPMPELLRDGGVYFNPEDAGNIAAVVEHLVVFESIRQQLAERAFTLSQQYSWKHCADNTFAFLQKVANDFHHMR